MPGTSPTVEDIAHWHSNSSQGANQETFMEIIIRPKSFQCVVELVFGWQTLMKTDFWENQIFLMTSKPSHSRQQMRNCAGLCTREKLCFDSITVMYMLKADEEDKHKTFLRQQKIDWHEQKFWRS